MSRKISNCAPIEFNRSARSSYPRLVTYTLRSTDVPCAAIIARRTTTAGRRADGHIISVAAPAGGALDQDAVGLQELETAATGLPTPAACAGRDWACRSSGRWRRPTGARRSSGGGRAAAVIGFTVGSMPLGGDGTDSD